VEVSTPPLQLKEKFQLGTGLEPPREIGVGSFFISNGKLGNQISIDFQTMKDYPWLSSYPAGVAKEIGPFSTAHLLTSSKMRRGSSPTKSPFENMGVQLTFRQVDELSTDFGAYLQKDLGLKKGDRIAIQMPNLLQFRYVSSEH